jgi:hypothetical protein
MLSVGHGYDVGAPLFPLIASNQLAINLGRRKQLVAIKDAESSATNVPRGLSGFTQTLDARLLRVNQILHTDNLPILDRAQTQECLLALEEIKMLLSELQLIQLREK